MLQPRALNCRCALQRFDASTGISWLMKMEEITDIAGYQVICPATNGCRKKHRDRCTPSRPGVDHKFCNFHSIKDTSKIRFECFHVLGTCRQFAWPAMGGSER